MTNEDRLDLQWSLLKDAHPKFCVSLRGRSLGFSLLVEPKQTDESTIGEFEKAKEFHDSLILLPDGDLGKAGQALSTRERAEYEAKHEFNQAKALATDSVYEFWSRAELWSLAEAAALINDRNPLVVTESRIESDRADTKITNILVRTLDLLERARLAGILHRTNSPKKLINWLDLKQIGMPKKLRDLALELSKTPLSLSAENTQLKEKIAGLEVAALTFKSKEVVSNPAKPFNLRERESLLKLILGMAIKGYSYDPKATKSKEIGEIAGDLQTLGLALDEDTVRKYLNEAKGLLPSD